MSVPYVCVRTTETCQRSAADDVTSSPHSTAHSHLFEEHNSSIHLVQGVQFRTHSLAVLMPLTDSSCPALWTAGCVDIEYDLDPTAQAEPVSSYRKQDIVCPSTICFRIQVRLTTWQHAVPAPGCRSSNRTTKSPFASSISQNVAIISSSRVKSTRSRMVSLFRHAWCDMDELQGTYDYSFNR